MVDFSPFNSTPETTSSRSAIFPYIQFNSDVNHAGKPHKTADIIVQIKHLEVGLVNATLSRVFTYLIESIANDLNPNVLPPTTETTSTSSPITSASVNATGTNIEPTSKAEQSTAYLLPGVRSEINVQRFSPNQIIDINIEISSLQLSLVATTLQRLLVYISAGAASDFNPTAKD